MRLPPLCSVVAVMFMILQATCTTARIIAPHQPRSKRIQQANSLQPVADSNEVSSEEQGADWVKISSSPGHVTTKVGSNIEIMCEAIGSPPPAILWLRDGLPVLEARFENVEENRVPELPSNAGALAKTVSRLVLPCVNGRDHGAVFTCIATAGIRSTLASSQLRVLATTDTSTDCLSGGGHLPAPRITLHNTAVLQVMGRDVVLSCEVRAVPRATIRWVGPTGQQPHGSRFKLLDSGSLMISRLSWADMGEYTCIAENSIGQDSASTFLYPMQNEEM